MFYLSDLPDLSSVINFIFYYKEYELKAMSIHEKYKKFWFFNKRNRIGHLIMQPSLLISEIDKEVLGSSDYLLVS